MAYFNLLASVPEAQIARLRADSTALLEPSLVSGASHLLAYWVQVQPLGGLLGRALDGGEVVRPELWHPLRPPLVHGPAAVFELAVQIEAALSAEAEAVAADDWFSAEVGRLLRLFRHAANVGECVVSDLGPPADAERAGRVRRLWAEPSAVVTATRTFTKGGRFGWLGSWWRRL